MRVELIMPQMGESIVEGTVVEWLKSVGDPIRRDEDVLVISTDKVDAEIPSPVEGKLAEIIVEPGETVEVGTVLAYVETEADGDDEASKATESKSDADDEETAEEPGTDDGDDDDDGADSEPATTPAAASAAGGYGAASGQESDDRPIGEMTRDELKRARSTPLVRKIAAEHGISDLSRIDGTGSAGRVTKQDILAYIESGGADQPKTRRVPTARESGGETLTVRRPTVHRHEDDRVEPMGRMRRSIAENMLQARRSTAHCHTVWEIDLSAIEKARKALRGQLESRGIRLTYTHFFVAAVAEALQRHPLMNAAIDGDDIIYRGRINIGIAAALEDGLIVPVLRDADQLSLTGIAKSVNDLATRAKQKELKPNDVQDGTFTITNSGVFGSLFGVPILVQPQVGILNIGGIKRRVIADEQNNIRIRAMAHFCLTFDHRLIDGAVADGFMRTIADRLEGWTVE